MFSTLLNRKKARTIVYFQDGNNSADLPKQADRRALKLSHRHQNAGLTVIEVAIAVTLLALFGTSAIEAMLTLNRDASSTRVISAAREIVQRNMETAMTSPFTSGNVPGILAVTTGIGWNETNDVTIGSVQIPLLVARDGTSIASGTLKRTVALLGGSTYNADTRRITFTLSYSLNGRAKPDYTLTSIRSPDS